MIIEERFIFSSQAKKKVFITIGVGIVLFIIGVLMLSLGGHDEGHGTGHDAGLVMGGETHGTDHKEGQVEGHVPHAHGPAAAKATAEGHDGHGEGHGGAHEAPHWGLRILKDIWLNNLFFTGISIIGVFFVAFNYVAQAGWGAVIKRVPEAFGYYLPFAAATMIIVFLLGHGSLFHWTHDELYVVGGPDFDPIVNGKKGYLNFFFFLVRMIVYFGLWYWVWKKLRDNSTAEDLDANLKYHDRSIFWSAIFLIIFGVTSSMAAWDWVMSIDVHFFSTMFGWYVFASWFISGLAAMTLIIVFLRENGYLPMVNSSHIHDLGKWLFAFSIFWTYIWFAQFLLIYYANIPEESIYFVERLQNDVYSPIFFMNFIINFCFPFLVLMARDAKRQTIILKIVCVAILFGHWMDFYLMITPPLLFGSGGMDLNFLFVELGITMIYAGIFLFFVLTGLSKAPLIAKNHPMLQESVHHHIY